MVISMCIPLLCEIYRRNCVRLPMSAFLQGLYRTKQCGVFS